MTFSITTPSPNSIKPSNLEYIFPLNSMILSCLTALIDLTTKSAFAHLKIHQK